MQDDRSVPPEGERPSDDPRFPPQSVLRRGVRRSAVITYVGGLVVLFALIGAGTLYWASRDKDRVDPSTPQAVGTVGSAAGGHVGPSPGGFDPRPRPDSTREEIEYRGALRDAPAEIGAATEIGDLLDDGPNAGSGRAVDFRDVTVDATEGRGFWIRDGGAKVAVVAPTGAPDVSRGNRVDVKGVAEPDGSGGVRVRAEQITQRGEN